MSNTDMHTKIFGKDNLILVVNHINPCDSVRGCSFKSLKKSVLHRLIQNTNTAQPPKEFIIMFKGYIYAIR